MALHQRAMGKLAAWRACGAPVVAHAGVEVVGRTACARLVSSFGLEVTRGTRLTMPHVCRARFRAELLPCRALTGGAVAAAEELAAVAVALATCQQHRHVGAGSSLGLLGEKVIATPAAAGAASVPRAVTCGGLIPKPRG
jgi:hypothetical protein